MLSSTNVNTKQKSLPLPEKQHRGLTYALKHLKRVQFTAENSSEEILEVVAYEGGLSANKCKCPWYLTLFPKLCCWQTSFTFENTMDPHTYVCILAWFLASAAVEIWYSVLLVDTQRKVVWYRCFWAACRFHLKGSSTVVDMYIWSRSNIVSRDANSIVVHSAVYILAQYFGCWSTAYVFHVHLLQLYTDNNF